MYEPSRLVLLILSFLLLGGCGAKEIYKRTELAMGTVVEISVADEDKDAEEIERAIGKAFEEIKRVEKLLSSYDDDSQICRLNRSGEGGSIAVSDETFEVIERSIEFSRLSEGAFDITIAPILELWGFGKGKERYVPTQDEINEGLTLVDFRNIIMDGEKKTIGFSNPGMKIDLGGIAKGYAVDRAMEALRREGIKGAMVNAGGDIYCLGTKGDGRPWVIGIKDPRKPGEILTRLEMKDQAVATSGDYEKYFTIEGKRYCHIIDPRSGYPVKNSVMSATVLAPTCLEADALATAVFVLGREMGMELIDSLEDVEVIIVSQAERKIRVELSEGLLGKVKVY